MSSLSSTTAGAGAGAGVGAGAGAGVGAGVPVFWCVEHNSIPPPLDTSSPPPPQALNNMVINRVCDVVAIRLVLFRPGMGPGIGVVFIEFLTFKLSD